jgi:hypothetical protein
MYNVVVTYVDVYGVTLCENDWTVFVDEGCGPDITCVDCIDFIGIEFTTEDECTYEFEMIYTADLTCEGLEITSLTWDYGYDGGTGEGVTDTHTFPEEDAFTVTATINYTFDGESCSQVQDMTAWVTGCDIGTGFECEPFELISNTNNSMTIGLPSKDPCISPTYEINITEFESGIPLAPATFATTEVTPGLWQATITGLEPCTSYEVQAIILCEGLEAGSCTTIEFPFETNCPSPCTGCVTVDEIAVISSDGCNYSLEARYDKTDACGDIDITGVYWDLGDGTTAEGDIVDIAFICGGIKTVTATIYYTSSVHPDIACVKTITKEIDATDCEGECLSCYDDDCVKAYDLIVEPRGDCLYWFTFDSGLGTCRAIDHTSISMDWNFGDGSTEMDIDAYWIAHTFPSDDVYTVIMTYNYKLLGDETEYSCTMTVEVDVKGCGEGDKPKHGQIIFESDQINAGSGIMSTTVPNPADEEVTITILDPNNMSDADQLQLVIFDINGREVYNGNTTVGSQKMIDVSHFESGLYIYEVRDGETVILKEKLLIK